jgi:hypothetical protein
MWGCDYRGCCHHALPCQSEHCRWWHSIASELARANVTKCSECKVTLESSGRQTSALDVRIIIVFTGLRPTVCMVHPICHCLRLLFVSSSSRQGRALRECREGAHNPRLLYYHAARETRGGRRAQRKGGRHHGTLGSGANGSTTHGGNAPRTGADAASVGMSSSTSATASQALSVGAAATGPVHELSTQLSDISLSGWRWPCEQHHAGCVL